MSQAMSAVTRPTLSDDLAERVRELIRTGGFEPGDRLPTINEMARRFGVGHPTLREALKKLETLGIVAIRHGSGVYVTRKDDPLLITNPVFGGTITRKLLVDLIEARIPVEVTSVELAARNATAEDLRGMAALMERAAASLDDDEVLSAVNMAFHRAIADSSGNRVLAQLLEVLTTLFQEEQRLILDIHGSRREDHAEHVEILEALEARSVELASHRMRAHLEGVREVLLHSRADSAAT
jgi:GntR family transcriptional regulator, transcriptional repressor for pyruvate dehydrogenase complex